MAGKSSFKNKVCSHYACRYRKGKKIDGKIRYRRISNTISAKKLHGIMLGNKKDRHTPVFLLRRRRDLLPVVTSIHSSPKAFGSNSPCYCHSLLLPSSATGSGRKRPSLAGARRSSSNLILRNKKRQAYTCLFAPEKERFELSRRLPDLHP